MVLSKKDLGETIKLARGIKSAMSGAKYTQANLSDEIGISRSYLGDIEAGRKYPNYVLLNKIADACGVPFSFFDNNIVKFNDRIKELREKKGLSIEELARLTNIDVDSIIKTENGDLVFFDIIKKICEVLDCDPEEFKTLLSYDWYVRGIEKKITIPHDYFANLTDDEMNLVARYRNLPSNYRDALLSSLESLERLVEDEHAKKEQSSTNEVG